MPKPIPWAAPVTIATLFVSFAIALPLSLQLGGSDLRQRSLDVVLGPAIAAGLTYRRHGRDDCIFGLAHWMLQGALLQSRQPSRAAGLFAAPLSHERATLDVAAQNFTCACAHRVVDQGRSSGERAILAGGGVMGHLLEKTVAGH